MKQTRFIPIETCCLQLREPQEGQTESRTVKGTPIVFGVRSVNLTPYSDEHEVYEVLEPGCITNDLLMSSDVILNLNHSNLVPDVLGRCRNGKGTLALELHENNVECECNLPHTNNANDALELMKRGDITGMSFAFEDDYKDSENGVSYERTNETHNGKEVWIRHVKRIIGLYDVAIVTHPAYEQTSVAVREQSERIDKAIEECLKREKNDKEGQKQREEAERKAKEEQERKEREAKEKAEREAQEQRQLEEQEQRFREQRALRLRAQRLRREIDFESL